MKSLRKAVALIYAVLLGVPNRNTLGEPHDALPGGRRATVDIILIDVSGSMTQNDYAPSRLGAAQNAACEFIKRQAREAPDTLLGIVVFGSKAKVLASPSHVGSDARRLGRAVRSAQTDGSTNLASGLALAGRQIVSATGRGHGRVILLTDGHSTCVRNPVAVASKLKESEIQIDAIGIGGAPKDVNEEQLRSIASVINGKPRYWFIRNVGALVRKFEALAIREF